MTISTAAVDANLYQFVCRYFDWAQAHPPGRRRDDPNNVPAMDRWATLVDENYGLNITIGSYDYMQTTGGLTVFMWGLPPDLPDFPIIGLDLAHDLTDATIRRLRDPIVAVLEERGIPFLPVSWLALTQAVRTLTRTNRIESTCAALQLVDRDGLQCVFRMQDVYYLSGYDANEDPPLYFMARLPGPVETYAEALESLKPTSVKVAEAQGIRVLRQGDMFAIKTTYRSHDLRAMGAVFGTNVNRQVPRRAPSVFHPGTWRVIFVDNHGVEFVADPDPEQSTAPTEKSPTVTDTRRRGLYGTAHSATELAYLPDGTMFARGAIVHDPRGVLHEPRNADHSELQLPGRTWYLVAKNTVPIQGGG